MSDFEKVETCFAGDTLYASGTLLYDFICSGEIRRREAEHGIDGESNDLF